MVVFAWRAGLFAVFGITTLSTDEGRRPIFQFDGLLHDVLTEPVQVTVCPVGEKFQFVFEVKSVEL